MKSAAQQITEPAPASEAPAVIELPASRPRRRGGVRRKALNPRVAHIHLRTTPARKARISADAKAARMTVTDYMLRSLPDSPALPSSAVAPTDPAVFVRMLAELGKWGSNLNQLAREKNTTGEQPEPDELERIAVALWDIRDVVLEALGRAD